MSHHSHSQPATYGAVRLEATTFVQLGLLPEKRSDLLQYPFSQSVYLDERNKTLKQFVKKLKTESFFFEGSIPPLMVRGWVK